MRQAPSCQGLSSRNGPGKGWEFEELLLSVHSQSRQEDMEQFPVVSPPPGSTQQKVQNQAIKTVGEHLNSARPKTFSDTDKEQTTLLVQVTE